MSPCYFNVGPESLCSVVQHKISDISRFFLYHTLMSSRNDVIFTADDVIVVFGREWSNLSQDEGNFGVHACLHRLSGKPTVCNITYEILNASDADFCLSKLPQLTHYSWLEDLLQSRVSFEDLSFSPPHSLVPSLPQGSVVCDVATYTGPQYPVWQLVSGPSDPRSLHPHLPDDHCGTTGTNTCKQIDLCQNVHNQNTKIICPTCEVLPVPRAHKLYQLPQSRAAVAL